LVVLVVNETRQAADSLGVLLSLCGYQTRAAYSDEDALRLAADSPDAVVLDLAMPGLDGWQLARRLRDGTRPKPRSWSRCPGTGGPAAVWRRGDRPAPGEAGRAGRPRRGAEAVRADPRTGLAGPLPKPPHVRW